MFLIEKTIVENGIKSIEYDNTFYDNYESAKNSALQMAVDMTDNLIPDNSNETSIPFHAVLIPDENYDAVVYDEYDEILYGYRIMELMRKFPV